MRLEALGVGALVLGVLMIGTGIAIAVDGARAPTPYEPPSDAEYRACLQDATCDWQRMRALRNLPHGDHDLLVFSGVFAAAVGIVLAAFGVASTTRILEGP